MDQTRKHLDQPVPIEVTCNSCGKSLKAKDSAAGQRVKCPECGDPIRLPDAVYDAEEVAADMKQIKSDALSTAEEVREFIANLKGRSPQEVLGAVSESGLIQATIQSTFGCMVVLVICTVAPWALSTDEAAVVAAEGETAATPSEVSEDTTTEPATETATTDSGVGGDASEETDATRAAAAMKIDETVITDPKSNPLDGNLDKLLDGLD